MIVASPVFKVDEFGEAPWNRGSWHGRIISVDGTEDSDGIAHWSCVRSVIAWGQSREDAWDGECAGVVQLCDGRFISWESSWGPTGSGFSCDAYGGDADVFVASTAIAAIRALSEQSIEIMAFAHGDNDAQLIAVLCDALEENAPRPRLMEIAATSGEFGDLFVYRVDDIIRRWSLV